MEMTWGSTTSDTFCSQEDSSSELEVDFTAYTSFFQKISGEGMAQFISQIGLELNYKFMSCIHRQNALVDLTFTHIICSLAPSLHPQRSLVRTSFLLTPCGLFAVL